MNSLDILVAARALLAEPYAWGKRYFVRYNKRGHRDCYCLVGALQAVAWDKKAADYRAALVALIRQADCADVGGLCRFNDAATTKKKDVLALLDRTIEGVSNAA